MTRAISPSLPLAVARAVAAAAAAVPGVVAVGGGRAGALATYGPRERVPGVSVHATRSGIVATVALVVEYRAGENLLVLAQTVRRRSMDAVAADVPGGLQALHVAIEDLRMAEEIMS